MFTPYDFMTSPMGAMPGMQPGVPPSQFGFMSMPPMGAGFPGPTPPTPEEMQIQRLRYQLLQLQFTKQNLEQYLAFVEQSAGEVEGAIKKLESAKGKKD